MVISSKIVYNAIVLIDYVNQLRAKGIEKIEAILKAGLTRPRPILMTTSTTILGLIPMADVAMEFGVTPNYFSSLFKKEVGENFVEYLTRYRIRIAKEILVQENIHISRVAEMVGYTDVKYFFRVFKKLEGITPKEYKQLNVQI